MNEAIIDSSEDEEQHGLVEVSIEVDPPLQNGIEHPCKVSEAFVTASGDVPGADLPAYLLLGDVADRRREIHEEVSVLALRPPWPKRVSQECELFVLI